MPWHPRPVDNSTDSSPLNVWRQRSSSRATTGRNPAWEQLGQQGGLNPSAFSLLCSFSMLACAQTGSTHEATKAFSSMRDALPEMRKHD